MVMVNVEPSLTVLSTALTADLRQAFRACDHSHQQPGTEEAYRVDVVGPHPGARYDKSLAFILYGYSQLCQ